jgi:hypothetical protein
MFNVSVNIAVAIFRVNTLVVNFLEALYGAGSKWDMTDLIGGVREWAAIQLAMSMWLRKSFLQSGEEKR